MIGKRLKQARLGAGMSMDGFVAKMGHLLTKQAISKYETGKSVPSPEILVRLAKTLGVMTSYFMQEPKVGVEFIAYRKHSRLPKVEENRLQVQITDHLENYFDLAALFPETSKELKGIGIPKPRSANTVEDAEKIAKEIRVKWDLGLAPIENLSETLEDHATVVLALEADERFDGISAWATVLGDDEHIIPTIVTNKGMPGDRQRFNLAHELGHLVIKLKNTKEDENIAHRFAAAFLVPDEVAFKELGRSRSRLEFEELLLLKHKYGLSMQAWLRRAKDLEIISFSWYKSASIAFRQRNWHKHEPGKQIASEQPIRFKQFVLRAMAENIISRERANELYPGIVSIDQKEENMTKTKTIAMMTLDERRKLLEAAAEQASHEYETDKELTVFTDLDGAIND